MNNKKAYRMKFICVITFILFAGGLFYTGKSLTADVASDIDYFKGKWTITMKSNPNLSFIWTVKEDLQGGWMSGIVEKNGEKVSTDFWRRDDRKIERFAFTADGLFVKIESSGWKSDRLILNGISSDKTVETKIRETITKISDRQFNALWEKESANGKWVVFADETCTK